MVRTEPIIAVEDVEKSSNWYQRLLQCKSGHGGPTFEILLNEQGEHILSLHKWGEHDHPTLMNPKVTIGNGLILYFVVADLDQIWKNAETLNATIEKTPQINPNSGRREFSLKDIDGYYLSICSNK